MTPIVFKHRHKFKEANVEFAQKITEQLYAEIKGKQLYPSQILQLVHKMIKYRLEYENWTKNEK